MIMPISRPVAGATGLTAASNIHVFGPLAPGEVIVEVEVLITGVSGNSIGVVGLALFGSRDEAVQNFGGGRQLVQGVGDPPTVQVISGGTIPSATHPFKLGRRVTGNDRYFGVYVAETAGAGATFDYVVSVRGC